VRERANFDRSAYTRNRNSMCARPNKIVWDRFRDVGHWPVETSNFILIKFIFFFSIINFQLDKLAFRLNPFSKARKRYRNMFDTQSFWTWWIFVIKSWTFIIRSYYLRHRTFRQYSFEKLKNRYSRFSFLSVWRFALRLIDDRSPWCNNNVSLYEDINVTTVK